MFELTEQDVFRLVDFFDRSDIAFLHVRSAGAEVLLSREAGSPAPSSFAAAPAASAAPEVAVAPSAPAPAVSAVPEPAAAAGRAAIVAGPGEALITAQSVGVFYRAPRPDLPAYVEVGTTVGPETTVGLIEAMKVFTGVVAEVQGTVTEILVANEDFVEFGQPLFRVALDA